MLLTGDSGTDRKPRGCSEPQEQDKAKPTSFYSQEETGMNKLEALFCPQTQWSSTPCPGRQRSSGSACWCHARQQPAGVQGLSDPCGSLLHGQSRTTHIGNNALISKHLSRNSDQMLRTFSPLIAQNSRLEGSEAFRPGCFAEYNPLPSQNPWRGSDGDCAPEIPHLRCLVFSRAL